MPKGRRGGIIFGVFAGLLFVPGSIVLHAWNEYRTIHRTHGIDEAESVVVPIADSEQVASELDQRLVLLTGHADTEETLHDDEFGIRERAVHLQRRVEMFQWVEREEKRDDETRYEYDRRWHEGRVNSESFRYTTGHENPPLQVRPKDYTAQTVTVGAYLLNGPLKNDMDDWEQVAVNQAALEEIIGPERRSLYSFLDNEIYFGTAPIDPHRPDLGDHRISFHRVPTGPVTLMARLTGNSFTEYSTTNGESFQRLYSETLTAKQFIGKLRTENTILAWGIRFGGLALSIVGIMLILGPARALFQWIPFVGEVTGSLFFVVAVLVGFLISVTTISISWLAVRPLLGLVLISISGVTLYALIRVRRSLQQEPPVLDSNSFV